MEILKSGLDYDEENCPSLENPINLKIWKQTREDGFISF
jgi:hypothetical protein